MAKPASSIRASGGASGNPESFDTFGQRVSTPYKLIGLLAFEFVRKDVQRITRPVDADLVRCISRYLPVPLHSQ